jgi:hypothetical protein
LPKTQTILMAVAACLAVVFGYVLFEYVRQDSIQKHLGTQIVQSRRTLSELPAPNSSLTQIYEESDKTNQAVKQSLTKQNGSITDVIDRLLQNADQAQVTVKPIICGDRQEKTIGNKVYDIVPLELTVSGNLSNVLAFVKMVENSELNPSVIVTNLSLSEKKVSEVNDENLITGLLSLSVVSGRTDSQ